VNIYWYWPFLRREEMVLADGVLRPGDRLTVHTTPRPTDPIVSHDPAREIRATLPGVRDRAEGSAAWMLSRGSTYTGRAVARRRMLRREPFDVAHVIYLNPFTDALDLASLQRHVPIVSTVHDVVPHHSRVPSRVEQRLLRSQYRHAGTILVHHDSVRRRLLAEFPIDPNRVVMIPLPITEIAPPRLDAGSPDPTRVGPPTVLFFGTFRRNKGVDVLLQAIAALEGEIDARFVFAGRGFTDVEQVVRDAAARDPRIVTEIGFATADRKHELHAAADLIVLPYTAFASQSAVLQDAYAHRLPMVVSDVGALGETVRDDKTGWVVTPGDPTELAATLLTALRDTAARIAASDAAAAVAEARTPLIVGAQLRALYERVADAP
jgi:glycosyltransferase involved in cell wall biosynthesis